MHDFKDVQSAKNKVYRKYSSLYYLRDNCIFIGAYNVIMTKTLWINTTVVYIISLKYHDTVATQQFVILCFSYYEKLEDSGVQFILIIDLNRYSKLCCKT